MPFILHFAHQILDVYQPDGVIEMPLAREGNAYALIL